MQCVVTGANGFIGRALAKLLAQRGHTLTLWTRSSGWFDLASPSQDNDQRWIEQLQHTDVVIHLAAHVHVIAGASAAEAEQHRQINCEGTLRLAKAAIATGVRRFIFLSSAKVFGEGEDGPYSSRSPARPQDAYSLSKWQAEQGLLQLAANTSMEVVIIRPPLVYGPEVGANFARLMELAQLPIPLPIAAIHNRRDMIGIDNLVDLIATCIDEPAAAGKVLLCSDGKPYSLADVVSIIRRAHGKPRHLFYLPPSWLNIAGKALLGGAATRRLFGNFELDISATRAALSWQPPLDMATILGRAR